MNDQRCTARPGIKQFAERVFAAFLVTQHHTTTATTVEMSRSPVTATVLLSHRTAKDGIKVVDYVTACNQNFTVCLK